jgi:hypothetical protein
MKWTRFGWIAAALRCRLGNWSRIAVLTGIPMKLLSGCDMMAGLHRCNLRRRKRRRGVEWRGIESLRDFCWWRGEVRADVVYVVNVKG